MEIIRGFKEESKIFLDNVRERETKKFYVQQFSSVQLLSHV